MALLHAPGNLQESGVEPNGIQTFTVTSFTQDVCPCNLYDAYTTDAQIAIRIEDYPTFMERRANWWLLKV